VIDAKLCFNNFEYSADMLKQDLEKVVIGTDYLNVTTRLKEAKFNFFGDEFSSDDYSQYLLKKSTLTSSLISKIEFRLRWIETHSILSQYSFQIRVCRDDKCRGCYSYRHKLDTDVLSPLIAHRRFLPEPQLIETEDHYISLPDMLNQQFQNPDANLPTNADATTSLYSCQYEECVWKSSSQIEAGRHESWCTHKKGTPSKKSSQHNLKRKASTDPENSPARKKAKVVLDEDEEGAQPINQREVTSLSEFTTFSKQVANLPAKRSRRKSQ